jgi:hypothetical protein
MKGRSTKSDALFNLIECYLLNEPMQSFACIVLVLGVIHISEKTSLMHNRST